MHADIGIGIILSIILTNLFGVELNAYYVIGGILFALLPDIDMVIFVVPGLKKVFKGHRELTHVPLVYLPIVVIVLFIAGSLWAGLFMCGIVLHLLHDTLWLGRGIKWLWPFSDRSFKSFPDKGEHITRVPWISWKTEQEEFDWRWSEGHGTRKHWIPLFYFRPTVVSISEAAIFILSLIILYSYIN
jgi:hypothetical protein